VGPSSGTPISGFGADLVLADGSKFLYALNPDPSAAFNNPTARSDIDGFRVKGDGTLEPLGTFGSRRLLSSSSGLVAP
jgi:hypothetical protein